MIAYEHFMLKLSVHYRVLKELHVCRSDHELEHELELDLFLLQICAALAPADLYVMRLVERFQLPDYLALDIKRSSEYVLFSNTIS